MLDFVVASSIRQVRELQFPARLALDGPVYWHLHRYFVHAAPTPEDLWFLDLYEITEVSGYALHRLIAELTVALNDLSARPERFPVLVGWRGERKSVESEAWETVSAAEVRRAIEALLALAAGAQASGLSLVAIGD